VVKKYWILFQISWQNGLAYPLSFLLWRFRQLLSTLMSLTIWTLVYANRSTAFGYDRSHMISYIFLIALLQGAILATSLHGLAGDIYSGRVSQMLIKPLSFLKYAAVQEVADKLKNVVLILLEMIVLYFIFQPQLMLPSWPHLILFGAWVALGIVLHFYIEILFGSLGFWSPQVWAPKFLFFVLVDVSAGKLFPLDVLPMSIQRFINLTPFPYLAYVQTQLFLGRLSPSEIWQYSLGLLGWTIGLGLLTHAVWQRGIRSYTAAGN
jgi:ABC-2 type transport system permease protein